MSNNHIKRSHLAPTALSQYVGLDNCDRYLRFYLYKGETDQLVKRLSHQAELTGTPWLPVQPLSGLLEEIGNSTELAVIETLQAGGYAVQDLEKLDVAGTIGVLSQLDLEPHYLFQVPMQGYLGRWSFEGRADIIRVQRQPDNSLDALIIDVKASRKDKVQHRLQVAVYVRMLGQMLIQAGLSLGRFDGSILRRTAEGDLQDPFQPVLFELEPYLSTVRFLTEGASSPLERVDAAPELSDLHYYLAARCDGCSFSPVCLTESAERQDLSLIPFLESTDKRVLNAAGIFNLADLASLKRFVVTTPPPPEPIDEDNEPTYETAPLDKLVPPNEPKKKVLLRITPGKERLVKELSQRWPLAPRLDRLIQRAALALRHFDKTTPARRYFLDRTPRPMRSNLPDEKLYPDLIKIFLDVQLDYLENRIYLVGALVTNSHGQAQSLVRICPDVPTPQTERKLLLDWVGKLFEAIGALAGGSAAPLHLYLYNRHDQKVLLDALHRHIEAFAALPALYYLLTDTPALNQPAIAFLHDEIRERLNLPGPLSSLQVVSRQLGFDWTDAEGYSFARNFRAGLFDYSLRRNDGVYIHTAARFYSGIPLEYAYAAWGRLTKATRSYKGTTVEEIEQFQAHRLKALAYIEGKFTYKNGYLKKEAVNLALLVASKFSASADLALVLEQFLHIEQYSNLQQHLELFSRPILKRIEQGQALLVRCTELEKTELSRRRKLFHATFLAEFDKVGLHPQTALQVNKLKEGDFVVISPLEKDGQPWEIVKGRLARIEGFSGEWIKLELSGSTLGQGQSSLFRYYHDRDLIPRPGQYYTIDPMVDNLNGDKLQEACRNAGGNTLYKLAVAAPTTILPITLPQAVQDFAALVIDLEGQERLPTADQLTVIAHHLHDPLFLIQGPPGTGKSHTIGWAVLARFVEALQTATTFRVIVSSQTHNAVEIVLESIVQKWRQLQTAGFESLKNLKLYKVGGNELYARSAEITFVDPWETKTVKAILDPENEANHLLVIGATPGNLYNLMKEFYGRGKRKQSQVWEEKFYDLLVLDEASQMNVPHALLAAAWLKAAGQTMIVGDHRQLAPILVHSWEHEEHLPTVGSRPYRSVFQFFLDAGYDRIALNESFRLHQVQAAFLQTNIYQQDGIHFHSRQKRRLPAYQPDDTEQSADLTAYLQAVLNPDYPIIVIEHNEANSQQYNQFEVDLLTPLISAATNGLGLEGTTGIGIVVPHRAQKAVLQNRFPRLAKAGAIDTVERFQGGERDLIIVSTTASDPEYIAMEAEFLLSPNRFNVALSRPRAKLIVISSQTIFQFVSARLELFEQALVWKRLAAVCEEEPLWQGLPIKAADSLKVKVFGHRG